MTRPAAQEALRALGEWSGAYRGQVIAVPGAPGRGLLEVGGKMTRCKTCCRWANNWFGHVLVCAACNIAYCYGCLKSHECKGEAA